MSEKSLASPYMAKKFHAVRWDDMECCNENAKVVGLYTKLFLDTLYNNMKENRLRRYRDATGKLWHRIDLIQAILDNKLLR